MLSLIRLLVVITLLTIHQTHIVDNVIRKWFGKGKVIPQKERSQKYVFVVRLFIILFFISLAYLVGTESWYIHLFIFLTISTIYAFEAILEKKYSPHSNDYKFTFGAGLLKAVLSMIFIMFLTNTGS